MKRTLLSLIFLNISLLAFTQDPILGLHGTVTWLDDTHIRVEYDWSDNAQLLDWVTTSGSTLVRENGTVTVTSGYVAVRTMIWKQGIKCSKIIAKDAVALSADGHHLNFYTNLTTFTGENYLPDPGLGAVLADYKNFWVHNGVEAGEIGAPYIVVGVPRDYEFTMSISGMTIKSSVNNVTYSYNQTLTPALDRKIALGGWGGNTRWGKITIEGEVSIPWQNLPVPSDVINIQSGGSVFAPVIEVTGTPVIEWIFNDSTLSSSATPVKDYGSAASRRNYLKVTPWSALIGINLGYDALDGGYGGFDIVASQEVIGFQNLSLAKNSLQYLCASYNPITELDLNGFTVLRFVELFQCQYLSTIILGTHPVLERLCVEDCDLNALDLSGCTALEDLRGASNEYTSINWGSSGQYLWHICIRDNPQMTVNLPALTQFPVLEELLNWNTSQTGSFECHNAMIETIESDDNHYTSADISGCTNLWKFYLSGSQLTSLNLGTANCLTDTKLKDCNLTKTLVDYVLQTLDLAGWPDGYLDITGNSAPSVIGMVNLNNLVAKGWTIEYVTAVEDPEDDTDVMNIILTGDEMRILLKDNFISWKAGLYNINGVRVISKLVDSDEILFDISSLAKGIYIIEITDGKQKKVKKLIVR